MGKQPGRPSLHHLARRIDLSQREQNLRGAVGRIFLVVTAVLVAKPERTPRAVPTLLAEEKGEAPLRRPIDARLDRGGHFLPPGPPRPHGVGGEIGGRAVEGQRPPATTKGGNASIAILQIEEPDDPGLGRG